MTDWYNRQAAANADTLLAEAAALFEKNPMLGVLSPSLPLWQGCTAARAQLRLGACAGVCFPGRHPRLHKPA